jgi:hypothetical protein
MLFHCASAVAYAAIAPRFNPRQDQSRTAIHLSVRALEIGRQQQTHFWSRHRPEQIDDLVHVDNTPLPSSAAALRCAEVAKIRNAVSKNAPARVVCAASKFTAARS